MKNAAASRLVLTTFSEQSVRAAAESALAEIGGKASCGLLFVSADFRPVLPELLEIIQVHGHVPLLVGCSASGLIGWQREAERQSGFSLLLLHLPETRITPFIVQQHDLDESTGPGFWHMESGIDPDKVNAWIVLADPLNLEVESWLRGWNEAYPGVPVVGGLASGGDGGDDIFLFHDRALVEGGAIAIAFEGGVRLTPLVSQGCQPIGEPFTITGARENVVETLGSRPAFEALSAAFQSLSEPMKAHAQGNIFAGIATSEYLDELRRGDFLIRNIVGANPKTGAVAIGALPRVGQTLQYQLRDRGTAHQDLVERATALRNAGSRPFAALLFSCTGRGVPLFQAPDHDAGVLANVFGPAPVAGFFCNGEIGPVGATNFVHGYTAAAALLADA